MKTLFKLLTIIVLSQTVLFCKPATALEGKLEELDAAIADQQHLEDNFLKENDSIKLSMLQAPNDSLRWEASYLLFYRHSHWGSDSALFYLNKMSSFSVDNPSLEARNRICRALSFAISGNKEKAFAQFSTVRPEEVGLSFIPDYFRLGNEIMKNLEDEQTRIDLLYEAAGWEENFSYAELQFISAEKEYAGNNDNTAMCYYMDTFNNSDSELLKSDCALRMAEIYGRWGDSDLMQLWMTEASILTLRAQSRNTEALYNLALILFKNRDLDRASNYIHQIIENSLYIGQNSRLILSSLETQQAISDALDYNKSTRLYILTFSSIILGFMLIIILILLANASKDRKRLRQSEMILAEANRHLKDSDLIKENFMFRYMQMSINYLASVEEYRHGLRKILREEGPDALRTMLRKRLDSGEKYDEFYRIFDENFLKLYPDFIRNVNTLLAEEDHFDPDTKELGTQLRILATIRLGLTDSGQIAKFLNCAPSSVYSYRSRFKHKATCGSENFEKLIKNFN